MEKNKTKLSILFPVRNEGVNIEIIVKVLRAIIEVSYEVLIVYDSPDDNSIVVVQNLQLKYPNVRLIHNIRGRGVNNAIISGIEISEGKYILIAAVDDLGPLPAINDMIFLLDNGCDLVSGTRYAYGGRRLGGSLMEGILSRFANRLLFIFSASRLTDSTTGLKMFRKDILDKITLESKGVSWAVVLELAIKAQVAAIKIGEVPIVSIDRVYGGQSSFSLEPWFREYIRWFFWAIKNRHNLKNKPQIIKIIPKAYLNK